MTDRVALAEFLATVRPGSRGDDWTWDDESLDLWRHDQKTMRQLADDIAANGQQTPVTFGDDGRVWDGHHRIVALDALAEQWVLVRRWDDLSADEQMEALLESCDDMELRQWREQLDRQESADA